MPIADDDAWMPGVKRLVIPGRNTPISPTLCLLHTNAGSHTATPEQLYQAIQNGIAAGNEDTTKPHFDIGSDGEIVQMLPINRLGVACYHAERTTINIETQDPGSIAGIGPWTDAQVSALAKVVAWISSTADIPLVRGLPGKTVDASHWQGWGFEGHCTSEVVGDDRGYEHPNTSKWAGKPCPTLARINQIDGILAAATVINTPSIPTPPTPPAPTPGGQKVPPVIIDTVGDAAGKGYHLYSEAGFDPLNTMDLVKYWEAKGSVHEQWGLAMCNAACAQFGRPPLG